MKILSKEEFECQRFHWYDQIQKGAVFIYPTDTIYGIGCDATKSSSVKKIRDIKQRYKSPFSVIAPSKQWIREHCQLNDKTDEWLKKLPGPYTLILNKKDYSVSKEVTPFTDTIGVRMPLHWFTEHIMNLGIPIVTTSANKTGEAYMTSLEDLDDDFKSKVSFIIYEGTKNGSPSTLVNVSDNFKIVKR